MAVDINGQPLKFVADIETAAFDRRISTMEGQIKKLGGTARQEASAFEGLASKAAIAAASFFSIQAASGFINQIIKVRGEFQQLDVAFTTMLGSKEKSMTLTAEMVKMAATTPYSLLEVANSGKQLLAYGFAAENVTDVLTTLGNVAAGVGAPIGDISYLYGTLRTQGRAYAKDIMQFSGRGIPIIAELAKQYGVAEEQVMKLVEAGKVGFPDVEKAFASMTTEGGMFFNLMDNQSKTLTGRISNLGDAFDVMLNSIGESNEGILYSTIEMASGLVENYEKVIDIIGGLITIYGAYRTALILEAALKSRAAMATNGWTAAEILRFQQMKISLALQNAWNAALLASPTVAFTAAIAALGYVTYALVQSQSAAEVSTKQLNDINSQAAQQIGDTKLKIETLVDVIKDQTKSQTDQETALKRLVAISPKYLEGLTLQNATTEAGKAIIDSYLVSLAAKAEGEMAYAQKQKNIQDIIELQTKGVDAISTADRLAYGIKSFLKGDITRSTELQNKRLVDSEVDKLVKANEEIDRKYGEKIKQNQINGIKPDAPVVTPGTAPDEKAAKRYARLIEERKKLEEDLLKGLSEARRQGMTQEDRDYAEIEARYEENIKRIDELNAKLKKGDRLGYGKAEAQRAVELGQVGENTVIEEYKKEIEAKKLIFAEFEQYKIKFGPERAQEEFKDQIGEFTSYLSYLDSELNKRKKDTSNLAKRQNEVVNPLKKEEEQKERARAVENLMRIYESTKTFNLQRLELERKYQEDRAIIEADNLPDKAGRIQNLKANLDEETRAINDAELKKSEIYKKFSADTTEYSKQQLRDLIAMYKVIIANSAGLSEELKAQLKKGLEDAEKQLTQPTKANQVIADQYRQMANDLANVSAAFGDLAALVGDSNAGLADTLNTMGELAAVGADAAASVASFASGDIVGGITKGIKSIVGLFSIAKKARESERKALQELIDFQDQQVIGELAVNATIRERIRLQENINALTLENLATTRKTLQEQKSGVENDYNRVMALLQKQQAIVGKETYKTGGFLGFGRKTETRDITQGLMGKSYDQIEQLFISGQLTDKAKELFQELQKIKEEGGDIDQMLEDNAREAREVFTGTTSDGILDTMLQAFADGKRGAADFADSFEEIMRKSILNSFKFSALEGPINEFYKEFAAAAESGGQLTQTEKDDLKARYDAIIAGAGKTFDELQAMTNTSLVDAGADTAKKGNSLSGAIKGMSQESADLISGQFGGLRITAIQQLEIAGQSLAVHRQIEVNTSRLHEVVPLLKDIKSAAEKNSGALAATGRPG